ncbi:MAG: hypothetical protein NZ576_06915 [Bacteroidia bacterium]|nr:hypothetical protein [Bacteroidia bacterium]
MPFADFSRYIERLSKEKALREQLFQQLKNERYNDNLHILVQTAQSQGYSLIEKEVIERIAPGESIGSGWLYITEYPHELAFYWHTVSGASYGISFPITARFGHILGDSSASLPLEELSVQEAIFSIAYVTMAYDGVLESKEAAIILEKMQLLELVAPDDIASLWVVANRVVQIANEKGLPLLFRSAVAKLSYSEKLLAFQISLDVMAAAEKKAKDNSFFLQALANALEISEWKAYELAKNTWFPQEKFIFTQSFANILFGPCSKVVYLQPYEALLSVAYIATFASGKGGVQELNSLLEKLQPILAPFQLTEQAIQDAILKIKDIADAYGLSILFGNAQTVLSGEYATTAFRIASLVVLADEIIETQEQDFLVALSKALRVSEDSYQNIIAGIIRENAKEKRHRFDEIFASGAALDIPLSQEEAILAIGYIAMLCDGVALESEASTIIEFMRSRELLAEDNEALAWQWIAHIQEISFNHGMGALFHTAQRVLSGPFSEDAFRLAVEIIASDQAVIEEAEFEFLIALAEALLLPEEKVHQIVEEVAIEKRTLSEYAHIFRTNQKINRKLLTSEALLALGYLTIQQIGEFSNAAMGALLDTFYSHPTFQNFKTDELWHLLSDIIQIYSSSEAGGVFNVAKEALSLDKRMDAINLLLQYIYRNPKFFPNIQNNNNFMRAMAKALGIQDKKFLSLTEQAHLLVADSKAT